MASERQIAANRQNAQRSSGPKTEEGKAAVALNPVKHGLTGKLIVLPGEDPNDYDEFLAHMMASLAPEGALEEVLVGKIAADAYRLQRVPALEAALHRRRNLQKLYDEADREAGRASNELEMAQLRLNNALREFDDEDGLDARGGDDSGAGDLGPGEGKEGEAAEQAEEVAEGEGAEEVEDVELEELNAEVARSERVLRKAQAKCEKLEDELADPLVQATLVLEENEDTFFNFERYETTRFHSFIKAHRELERLQAARTGKRRGVRDIVEVDVTVDDPKSIEQK